jgi:UDP-glucuronate decarboxylase
VVHRPLPPDDPVQRRPEVDLAAKRLGWRPTIGLEEGLRTTIADFRLRLAQGD